MTLDRASLVPWGLLGMVALLALSERHVKQHDLDFTRPEAWNWTWSGHAARHEATRCRVLCFGTSRAQQGIIPQVVEERSGLRTWNLSTCWGQAPSYYYLLKRALDRGARPAAVIVEYHPQCLANDYWQAVRFWPNLLVPAEILDLAWAARDAEFLASTLLAQEFPSIRGRLQIRANVLAALRGWKDDLEGPTRAYARNVSRNRGAILQVRNATFRGDATGPTAAGLLPDSWACDPTNEVYIRRFLDLAAARGIAVYWMMPPFCPELQAKREQKGLDTHYARFAQGFLDRYPNLVVLDAERSGYGSSVFLDPAHLDRRGAITLSADLGDLLRRAGAGAGTRRIEMPPYRDFTPITPLEDPYESHVALDPGKARR